MLDTSIPPYGKKPNQHYITIKFLYCFRIFLTNPWTMNIWMMCIKQICTAFIWVSGLKLWSLSDYNCAILLRGAPWAHSFNQSLSWPYIFVYSYHLYVEYYAHMAIQKLTDWLIDQSTNQLICLYLPVYPSHAICMPELCQHTPSCYWMWVGYYVHQVLQEQIVHQHSALQTTPGG